MKITFVLPGFTPRPSGGFAVVYRYANELSRRGHAVTVIHACIPERPSLSTKWVKSWLICQAMKFMYVAYLGRVPWFKIDDLVTTKLAGQLRPNSVPQADAVFATACSTAVPVSHLPFDRGTKFYLIQHYENWGKSDQEVNATWQLPMHKVVISKWLQEIGVGLGEAHRLTYIPNGFDSSQFPLLVAPEDREATIGMLAHRAEFKGTRDGVAAITLVRKRFPATTLTLFGILPRPSWIPQWAEYVQNPSHETLIELYNSFAIFLHSSWSEGFPLPPGEAMLSGCAVVAAANRGVQEYAVDDENVLLAPVRDPNALADRVCTLLEDPKRRFRLAWNGHTKLKAFSWEHAVDAMEDMLVEQVQK